jgi:hypothetical protein
MKALGHLLLLKEEIANIMLFSLKGGKKTHLYQLIPIKIRTQLQSIQLLQNLMLLQILLMVIKISQLHNQTPILRFLMVRIWKKIKVNLMMQAIYLQGFLLIQLLIATFYL